MSVHPPFLRHSFNSFFAVRRSRSNVRRRARSPCRPCCARKTACIRRDRRRPSIEAEAVCSSRAAVAVTRMGNVLNGGLRIFSHCKPVVRGRGFSLRSTVAPLLETPLNDFPGKMRAYRGHTRVGFIFYSIESSFTLIQDDSIVLVESGRSGVVLL